MTEKEAIEKIRKEICNSPYCNDNCKYDPCGCAYGMAMDSLEEIHLYKNNKLCLIPEDVYSRQCSELDAYKEIGTVEECRKAVDKQKPKKIIIRDWNPTKCPTCGHELSTSLGDGYYKHPTFLERCPKCGQTIQWENEDD